MPKFNMNDYVNVEERVEKFREKHPDGQIKTELVATTEDLQSVIVRAEVYDKEGKLLGSDLAQDHQGTHNFANEYSWVEVASTSAIGRALFNAGFQKTKGEKKATREEMQKVVDKQAQTEPKKKQVTQEIGKSPSKITENGLKKLVFSSCDEDQEFAQKCYKDCLNRTIIKTNQSDVTQWEDSTIRTFLDLVDIYVDKHKESFEQRKDNPQFVNEALDVGLELVEKEEEDVDFTNDEWKKGKEADPMTDAQEGFLESLITKAIDKGLDELAAEAKQYLNSGNTSKVSCSDMINKLKNAIDKASG